MVNTELKTISSDKGYLFSMVRIISMQIKHQIGEHMGKAICII